MVIFKLLSSCFTEYDVKEETQIAINLGNLKQILSIAGCALIFSVTGLISFLFFTGISLITKIRNLRLALKSPKRHLLKQFIVFLFRLFFKPKEKKQKPGIALKIKQPIYNDTKPKAPLVVKQKEVKINNKTFDAQIKKPVISDKLTGPYNLPPLNLLTDPAKIDHPTIKKELTKQAEILEATLKNFGIEAKVGEINCGPTITSFEVHPSIGVKVQKIKSLENDIALNLESKSIRIIAPIPGKAAVGVEVPSLYPQEVSLKEMLVHLYLFLKVALYISQDRVERENIALHDSLDQQRVDNSGWLLWNASNVYTESALKKE